VNPKTCRARGAGDSGRNKNPLMLLPAASRALNNFVDGSWGSAALHPRLYAIARYRGLGLGILLESPTSRTLT